MRVSSGEVGFYALCLLWFGFITYTLSGREIGMFGVETDWYGCYAPQADAFIQNGTIPIDDFRGPLYQVTLGLTSALVGDTWRAGQAINLLFSLLCLVLVWGICKELRFSDTGAFIATLALALTPAFIRASVECGTDVFFLAITLSAIWAVITDRDVLAGVMIALAILTRSTGFALLAPAVLLSGRKWIPIVLIAVLGWGIYTKFVTGDFFHNMNFLNTAALTTDPNRLEELWYGDGARPQGWLDMLSVNTALSVWQNAQSVIAGLLTKLWFFPASLLGFYGLSKIHNSSLFALVLMTVPMLCLIAFDTRYALTIAPCYAIGLGALCEQ